MTYLLRRLFGGLCIGVFLAHPLYAATASFTALGDLTGGAFNSQATTLSSDGTTVVGYSISAAGTEAFRWNSTDGMVGLGFLPGGSLSQARGVSADGSVIIGYSTTNVGPVNTIGDMFRWTSVGGMTALGLYSTSNGFFTTSLSPNTLSDDGTTIGYTYQSGLILAGYIWTSATGSQMTFGSPGNGTFALSADGTIAAGQTDLASGPAIWTSATGAVGLGNLPGGTFGEGRAMSPDGSFITGNANSSNGNEAFYWSSGTGMVALGDLPGGTFDSRGLAINDSGAVIVGYGNTATGQEAMIWDPNSGMRNLKDLLQYGYGIDLTGWTLRQATGLSADGTAISGWGINPLGQTEAWFATIPEPSSYALLILAAAALAGGTKRKRN